jgi:PEP-CTERM motif
MKTQTARHNPAAIDVQPEANQTRNGTMKSHLNIATLFAFTVLGLALAAAPAAAGTTDLYDNGAIFGDIISPGDGGLTISTDHSTYGYAVSNSYGLAQNSQVKGFQYGIWAYPGDQPLSVDWTISSQKGGGGTVYGAGTATIGGNGLQGTFASQFVSSNAFGYDIDVETVTGLSLSLGASHSATDYWLTLQNATTGSGNPVFWDENSGGGYSGSGCGGADGHGLYCPSSAEQYYTVGGQNDLGPVPSESFTINGGGSTPEPSSLALFGSGVLGLGGLLRRRLLG